MRQQSPPAGAAIGLEPGRVAGQDNHVRAHPEPLRHVCPGADLARLELRIVMEELLAHTCAFALVPERPPVRAIYPASGFSSLALRINRYS